MRRILATATLGLALFGAAACADTKPEASSTPTPGAASSAAAPAGVDKKTACANLTKATSDFEAKIVPLFTKLMDPATQAATLTELGKAIQDFQAAYSKDVAAMADADLKAAVQADLQTLTTTSTALVAAGTDQAKIQAALSTPEFDKAGDQVKALCAGA
ncbi:hypothetical protein [Catellatospora sichuanensis]|uniref:hypothetical protein n=1 Tax=Catellatospora sichuanensis TaxID=1969805 RepID=UPI001181E32A|nr:hypothetical protein [Catellatospora sichuanensis]